MSALLPALLVALFAFWSGTFHGGASFAGALAGDVAVVACAAAAVPRWGDPLRIGRGPAVLVWALLATLAASTLASPVPRAGLEWLVVLPAFLLLPAAVESMWGDVDRRRRGSRALAMVGGSAAVWGLFEAVWSGSWRAAAPLGHHGALAVWLLFVVPFGALMIGERGGWRLVGVLVTASSVGAILATRSLVGVALLLVQAALLTRGGRLRTVSLLVIGTVVAVLFGPRWVSILTGSDPSTTARGAYFAAGLAGIRARPGLGWGPGSVGWTIGEHLRPVPGRNPPGEVVSYLHLLPLDVAYQAGVAAALLVVAVAVAFIVARRRERAATADPPLLQASMAALVPGLVGLCLAGFQPLAATTVVAAIVAGAALAATPRTPPERRPARVGRLVLLVYATCAIGALAPARLAQRSYEEARVSNRPLPLLTEAARRDRAFPLYTARRAWGSGAAGRDGLGAAGEALRAAESAPGVAALWLAAGLLGVDSGATWSGEALRRACDLDPLGAMAPFRLAMVEPDRARAAVAGGRALVAEPRLAAATDWEGRGALFDDVVGEVARWPGLEVRWRARLVAALHALPPPRALARRSFSLELDGEAQSSLSLFVFRRLPWPTTLGSIELDDDRLPRLDVGSAALRADTEPWALPINGCGGAEPPPGTR